MLDKIILFIYTRIPRSVIIIGGYTLLLLISVMDYLTDYLTRMSGLYIFPVFIIATTSGTKTAFLAAFLASLVKGIADLNTGGGLGLSAWNSLMTFITYIILITVLIRFRGKMINERRIAITDILTGLYNLAGFYEIAGRELVQAKRYNRSASIIYFDCDNFKCINDTFGHSVGDELLRTVANILKSELRETDCIFRWGGDEFIILLTNTGQEGARIAAIKLQSCLLAAMREKQWPVTFSIGVATFANMPSSLNEMLASADKLMYLVKNSGKNAIRNATY